MGKDAEGGDEKARPSPSLFSSFAWLIPSFAALLIANGFIVQSAQENLLGVAIYVRDSQSYLNTSADFIRDVTIGLIDGICRWHFPEIVSTHPLTFLAAGLGTLIIALLCWAPATRVGAWLVSLGVRIARWTIARLATALARRRARHPPAGTETPAAPPAESPAVVQAESPASSWFKRLPVVRVSREQRVALRRTLGSVLPPMIVLALVLMRVAVVDVPILRIGGLATRSEGNCWSLAAESSEEKSNEVPGLTDDEKKCREITAARGYNRIAWNQARKVAAEIVCSRGEWPLPALPPIFEERRECHGIRNQANAREADQDRARIRDLAADEFYADLLLTMITCALALGCWYHARSALFSKLAVSMALISSLTVPYVYGKVAAPEEFEQGELRISPALAEKYQALGDFVDDDGWIRGFVLQREQGDVELLAIRKGGCGSGQSEAFAVRSTISTSQILSFDEVRRVDIIGWLIDGQYECRKLGVGN